MNNINIRKVTLEDIDQLQKIATRTFFEAFSASNTGEDMKKYLEESFSIKKLTGEVTNENSEFYFAGIDDKVIGYIKVNSGDAQTDLESENALEIERIYVLKEFQGGRVGQLLYEQAVQIAMEKNVDYVWLGVWEKNPRAISFYKKNGFVEFGEHIFKLGDDHQTDILMKMPLINK